MIKTKLSKKLVHQGYHHLEGLIWVLTPTMSMKINSPSAEEQSNSKDNAFVFSSNKKKDYVNKNSFKSNKQKKQ